MTQNDFFDHWAVVFIGHLMRDFKLDLESSVAIVGNLGHESGGFKALQEVKPMVPGSRGGWGIAQWTGPRRRAAEAYWKRNGLDPKDMMANYKFLFVELNGPEGRVLPKLRAADGLNAKVEVFCNGFLRPGIPHMASRKIWANRALAAWHGRPKDAPVAEPEPQEYNAIVAFLEWLISLFKRKN